MKNNEVSGFFSNRWFYRLIALVFAILLFVYVNGSKLENVRQSGSGTNSSLTSNKKKTITMPLELTVDSDKYVVSGYPENVKVTLSGPAALVTTTANTQNFKVYVDLNSYGAGNHTVKIKQSGLNKDLNYDLKPNNINVKIENRKTVTKSVDVVLSSRKIADGYKLGKATSSVSSVKVTGSVGEINKVRQVIASVNIANDTKKDISRHVTLQAIDKEGNTVNVVVTPQTADVTIPVTRDADSSSGGDSSDSGSSENSSATSSSIESESTSSAESSESESSSN